MTELLERLARCLRAEDAQDVRLDPTGRVVQVGDGDRVCAYSYDARGDLVGIDDPALGASRFGYDERRRLVLARHPGRVTSYRYDDRDRLVEVASDGHRLRAGFDGEDRVVALRHDDEVQCTYRYDEAGRIVEARAGGVVTRYAYDGAGRTARVEQVVDGAGTVVDLARDGHGRLRAVVPAGGPRIGYQPDAAGRPALITVDGAVAVEIGYDDERKLVRARLGNGVVEEARADPIDGRTLERTVSRDGAVLLRRRYTYDAAGRIVDDGRRRYGYDAQSRLVRVRPRDGDGAEDGAGDGPAAGWDYGYDRSGNLHRVSRRGSAGPAAGGLELSFDGDRLLGVLGEALGATHDPRGGLTGVGLDGAAWAWRYDAAGRLVQVRRGPRVTARLRYDHVGRLAVAQWADPDQGGAGTTERYVYGPDDVLLAVTDGAGVVVRVPLRTPWAVHAEALAGPGRARLRYLHSDDRGTLWLATGEAGEVLARYDYDAFGEPLPQPPASDPARRSAAPQPTFGGRPLVAGTGCYWFGARWYNPRLRRFLTRDTWTAGPDDERLVHPALPGRQQPTARAEQLAGWLRRPRLRAAFTYCGNDPVNRTDPDGHWSFGGVLLSLLGAIWTLPNTLIGLILEISCVALEVVRWLAWVVTAGHVSWETLGADAAASGRLNAFALVFPGGWLGSFQSLQGITFGNVFFVYGQWERQPEYTGPGDVLPPAYHGTVRVPRTHILYEHELRHTNQYGWFGPSFLVYYIVDAALRGYSKVWAERDAREHSEGPDAPVEVVATRSGAAGGPGVAAPALAKRWVYWRAGGATTVLRAGPDGVLHATSVPGSTRPWDFTARFEATVGDPVDVASSAGARPLPPALLATPGLLTPVVVLAGTGGRAQVDVPDRTVAVSTPAELGLWPLPHDLPTDAYVQAGLPQGAALWTTPAGGNDGTNVAEGTPAPDPGAARPGTRGLRVRGDVEAAATTVRVRLLTAAGQPVALTPDPAGHPRTEVTATLPAPGPAPAAGRQAFEAVLEAADPAATFGEIYLGVVADTPTGPVVEAFTGQLCGLQLALVDDPTPTQPGAQTGEADEVVVVDFDASPRDTPALLADQARTRRMVRYRIANEPRPLPAGGAPVLRPRMPLWMGEVQLVGVTRTELEDLLRRRADRRGTPPGAPAGPFTTRISFRWRLRLSWDGPDGGSAAFGPPFPRPNQRHAHTLDLPRNATVVTAVLSYDDHGRLTDPKGVVAPADPAGALPGALQPAPAAAPYPAAGRRLPAVRLGPLRPWGRARGVAALPSLVVEFQPSVEDATGEVIRGGDGVLAIDDVSLDGTPVDPGSPAAGGPAPPAGSPLLRLPPVRVHGQNVPAATVEDVVRALVREYVAAHAAAAHIAALPAEGWAETVLRILRHESGGQYRQFDERGPGRRPFRRQAGSWWFGTENGMPLFGPPHGYGIGQLDLFDTPQRGANDEEVWNWVENLRAAVRVVLADKALSAWTLIGLHVPAPLDRRTRAVFQRETVRRYNGGTEFVWTGASWAMQPSLQWLDAAAPGRGPHPNVLYPNQVLGTAVVYYTDAAGAPNTPDGANTQFRYPPPIPFVAADFGPGTGP